MIGKMFVYDNAEWVVEEILLYGHRCKCRSYYSDRTKQFYCDFVQEKIINYEQDLIEKHKIENAIVFKEEDEKELIKEVLSLGADIFKRCSEDCCFDKYIKCKTMLKKIK